MDYTKSQKTHGPQLTFRERAAIRIFAAAAPGKNFTCADAIRGAQNLAFEACKEWGHNVMLDIGDMDEATLLKQVANAADMTEIQDQIQDLLTKAVRVCRRCGTALP